MKDSIIINGYAYQITDSANDITISLAQRIDELIPKNSYYRNIKNKYEYNQDLAIDLISAVTGATKDILKRCDNIFHIYSKFIQKLLISIYYPEAIHLQNKKYNLIDDIYENESIYPFAEACDLLSSGQSIEVAEFIVAIYYRKKKEKYTVEKAKERAEYFNQLPYSVFVYVLSKHNEAATKVRQLHSDIFSGSGDSKSMSSLISMAAEKGIFNSPESTPLNSTRNIKVGEFFDYIESIN